MKNNCELSITHLIKAPCGKVYEAWTNPELLKQWFAPKPWTTPEAILDVRAGGTTYIVMQDPEGNKFPGSGVYLEVIPDRKIVFTDAYSEAWEPSGKPFMTVIVTFENEDGNTRYTAKVLHWTEEDRKEHEKMGFYEGWEQCTRQLADLVEKD